jgi:DNA-binding MarR family transcriptional regulator
MSSTSQDGQGRVPEGLKAEIRQNRPFRSKGHEAYLALLRTADMARHRAADIFAAEDLTLQQYNVLRSLRGAGPDGLPTLEIVDRMIERTPGITRLVDKLEEKGLASRQRPPDNRRTVLCRVTPKGLAVLAELDGPIERFDDETFLTMDESDLDDLVRILERLRGVLAD